MSHFNLKKAIDWNPHYARKTGWIKRHVQVLHELGFRDRCPGEGQFATAVYQWQLRHPPLKADGILGPRTWRELERHTRYSVNTFMPFPGWANKPKPPSAQLTHSTDIWFGLGGSYGGHFFAIGKTSGHAVLFSADDFERSFVMTTENWRFGPGLGGSWGIALIVITSLSNPIQLNSHTGEGWDFNVGLGSRWGEVAKNLKYSNTVRRIIERVKKMEDAARNPITKQVLKLSFNDWMAIKSRIKELVDATGMKTDDVVPHMMGIGIPVPYSALEISGFWGFSTYRIESMSN